jgi:hypothetical protein
MFAFGADIPSRTFMYMSESSDPYKYVLTTSINYKELCFCVVRDMRYRKVIPFITKEYVSMKPMLGLCVNVSHNLIVLISFLNENSLEPDMMDPRRCRYHIVEYISFS